MKPDLDFITINNNRKLIEQLLHELVLEPRINALRWSGITHQTPNIKIGYPGQHLASLVTGIKGSKTGARGDDLEDGTEVKSCSRIDQMDRCKDCKAPVARNEKVCLDCGSSDIQRKDDSKWLFAIKSEDDLKLLTEDIPRILLILGDYPKFKMEEYDTLRFQCFEIWTNRDRHQKFKDIMSSYYHNIYLVNKNNNPQKTPAPKNFWPYRYEFYLCNPILTFSCIVTEASTRPNINIDTYIEPSTDRSEVESIWMPSSLLNKTEKKIIKAHFGFKSDLEIPEWISESERAILPLRETKKGFAPKTPHSRKSVIKRKKKSK